MVYSWKWSDYSPLTEEYRLAAALLGAWVFNILFNPVKEPLCKWGFDTYTYYIQVMYSRL